MTLRKIGSFVSTPVREARVYRDAEWNEYRVKFYLNGHHMQEEDYHTDDKQDAMDTAALWAGVGTKGD